MFLDYDRRPAGSAEKNLSLRIGIIHINLHRADDARVPRAVLEDSARNTRIIRTIEIDMEHPDAEAKVLFSRNQRDAYHNPGTPVARTTPDGKREVMQTGDTILMSGIGSSPTGDHPFVDRLNLTTGKTERLFQSGASGYEVWRPCLTTKAAACWFAGKAPPSRRTTSCVRVRRCGP